MRRKNVFAWAQSCLNCALIALHVATARVLLQRPDQKDDAMATFDADFSSRFRETSPTRLKLQFDEGLPAVLRFLKQFCGICLSFAGLFLLVFPFGMTTPTEVLSKMMVALVLGFVGAALYQSGRATRAPELEIDMARREIRVVRWNGASHSLAARRKFTDLTRAEISDSDVRLWDADGTLLAEISVTDTVALGLLRGALREEGVLA